MNASVHNHNAMLVSRLSDLRSRFIAFGPEISFAVSQADMPHSESNRLKDLGLFRRLAIALKAAFLPNDFIAESDVYRSHTQHARAVYAGEVHSASEYALLRLFVKPATIESEDTLPLPIPRLGRQGPKPVRG